MKRRIISLFFAVLLMLPSAFAMAATTPVIITTDDVRGNVGDTVTVTLNVEIEPPKLGQTMDSLQFVLEYDSATLEFEGIQEVYQDRINILGTQYLCSVTTKAGAVAFTAAATDGATGSGVLMHVRFRILSPVSTMLVLKKVAYSFVSKSGTSQDRRQGGTINLGRITGQSVPTTIIPETPGPMSTPEPAYTNIPTNEPRFPVTEVTMAPGANPTSQPEKEDNDILAYIVFGLFIVVAILICVVLALMLIRRSRNKARAEYFEEDDEYDDEYESRPVKRRQYKRYEDELPEEEEDEEDEDEPPIRIVRRGNKK